MFNWGASEIGDFHFRRPFWSWMEGCHQGGSGIPSAASCDFKFDGGLCRSPYKTNTKPAVEIAGFVFFGFEYLI